MTTSLDEAMRDAFEQTSGYDQDVACEECGAPAVIRVFGGEPVDATDTVCSCGGLRVSI